MMHILVVDDEPDLLRILETALQPCGTTRVTTARRSLLARSVLMRESVDLVITDARMPGESGISLARAAAELGIPCIIMTGDAEWAIGQGAHPDALLLKPFDAAELRARVERSVRRRNCA